MSRTVRDSNLETRTARSRLKPAHKPYFRLVEPGLALGYRKLASGPGTWVARRYKGNGSYTVENLRTADGHVVIADDYSEPDGNKVLTFAQAQQRAKMKRTAGTDRPWTVGDALDTYLRFLESEGKPIYDVERRDRALIRPKLGDVKLSVLTTEQLRHWRDGLVNAKARHGKIKSDDARRARRATANRTWTVLRAALNHAFSDGKVESDLAWRKVKQFRKVDSARVRYLTVEEARRLVNACDADFRALVQAALESGCRYGELCALTVADFNPDVGTVAIRQSKSGKPRHVVLTDEGRVLFQRLTAGRAGDAPMFGKIWGRSHQTKPMAAAVKRACITPKISFHGLRHTWASLAVMNGMPLMVVARNLGHVSTQMVEKHYGHLAASYIVDAVRASAPRFGIEIDKKIVLLTH